MDEELNLPESEVSAIANQLQIQLAEAGSANNNIDAKIILNTIQAYQKQVETVTNNVFSLVSKDLRKSTLQLMKETQLAKQNYKQNENNEKANEYLIKFQQAQERYHLERQEIYNLLIQNKIIEQVSDLYVAGYKIVMSLRKYITDEDIEYNIAIEGESESIIYKIDEEQLLSNLDFDLNRFVKLLITSKTETLDASMRYRASLNRAKQSGQILQDNLINSSEESSTLWSLGYKVYQRTRDWYLKNQSTGLSKGFGVNFGHFLETYYSMGGDKENHSPESFSNTEFLQKMLELQNSQKFYEGGDFELIQLKSNTATLTNLKAITNVLNRIEKIISKDQSNYKINLLNIFKKDEEKIKRKIRRPKRYQEALQSLLEIVNT